MKITVNGRKWDIPGTALTYHDIFGLAFPDRKQVLEGASITYYWKGDGDNFRQGIICKYDTVMPAEGMMIECCFAGNA